MFTALDIKGAKKDENIVAAMILKFNLWYVSKTNSSPFY